MAYRVEVLPRAARDLRRIYRTIKAAHAEQAQAWFNALTELILNLDHNPSRGAPVAEGHGLRHVLYGRGRNIYRVIYSVDEARALVSVVHVRHSAQDAFRHDEDA
jgi:plasmid stabilization system protein ParE